MSRRKATGADLKASGLSVRLVRRRRSPSHPWRWRVLCDRCSEPVSDWTASEQAATELGFEHARRHREPQQLELELDVAGRRRRRRRAA